MNHHTLPVARLWMAAPAAILVCQTVVACGDKLRKPTLAPGTSSGRVLASKNQSIGPKGRTLALDTGVRLVLPAGAVGESVSVQVKPDRVIPAGVYTVIDSDPTTWSQNEETGGRGMSWGYGIPR